MAVLVLSLSGDSEWAEVVVSSSDGRRLRPEPDSMRATWLGWSLSGERVGEGATVMMSKPSPTGSSAGGWFAW